MTGYRMNFTRDEVTNFELCMGLFVFLKTKDQTEQEREARLKGIIDEQIRRNFLRAAMGTANHLGESGKVVMYRHIVSIRAQSGDFASARDDVVKMVPEQYQEILQGEIDALEVSACTFAKKRASSR